MVVRVEWGDYSPQAPTDPDERLSRVRFLNKDIHYL